MQGWLEHANIENASAQCYRRRMCSDKFPDDFSPGVNHFRLMQTLAQPEALHQFWKQLGRRLPPIAARFSLGETSPFGDHGSTERRIHGQA
jgi:hypothetical protein